MKTKIVAKNRTTMLISKRLIDVGEHGRILGVEPETSREGPALFGQPLPHVQRFATS